MQMRVVLLPLLLGLSMLVSMCAGNVILFNSRSHLCSEEGKFVNKNCGPAEHKPGWITGRGGFPELGPKDGKIASGDGKEYRNLDEYGANRWFHIPSSSLQTNISGQVSLNWVFRSNMTITSYQFYITKADWNRSAPLEREQLEATPLANVSIHTKITAPFVLIAKFDLDVQRLHGHHTIVGVLNTMRRSTSYYQILDVAFPDDSSPESESSSEDSDSSSVSGSTRSKILDTAVVSGSSSSQSEESDSAMISGCSRSKILDTAVVSGSSSQSEDSDNAFILNGIEIALFSFFLFLIMF